MRHEFITGRWPLAGQVARLMMSLGHKPCVTRGSTGQFLVSYTPEQPQELIVRSIKIRRPTKEERVYDLTVEESHSFVAGTAVVHNCHRMGQLDNVMVHHIVLADSLDARIAAALVRKQEIIDMALDRQGAHA